jgi:transcriptional regulator with XRE-family HTH domain
MIGDRIKQIRKINDLTQIEFANTIGISQGTLSDIENERCNPSVETLLSIKKKYSTDLNWLISGKELSGRANKELFNASLGSIESILIIEFRKMNLDDQEEIMEFIQMKRRRNRSRSKTDLSGI